MTERPEPHYPPRGLSRCEAANYVGISPAKFDQLVKDGRMPPPRRIDGRRVWDRSQLDSHFDQLPGGADDAEAPNPWDA